MRLTAVLGLLTALIAIAQPTPKLVRNGIALLIGNINYPDDPLDSVREDLNGMEPALRSLGFEVDIATDLDRPEEFRNAVRDFLVQRKASADDIIVVLYSGHGMQLEGKTYFLGKNYRTVVEPQAAAFGHAYSADQLVNDLQQAASQARIVIVDACRLNAFSNQTRRGGIAFRQDFENTIVIFSNEPGKTVPARALATLRSPFIEAFTEAIATSRGGIKEIFEKTRSATLELNPAQIPQMFTSTVFDEKLLAMDKPRAPSHRAAALVNQARVLYDERSWLQYREIFQQARAISADATVTARITNELHWVDDIEAAEAAAVKSDFKIEAISWDRAFERFPARTWTLQQAALARLKADNAEDAIPILARLMNDTNTTISSRARRVLESLIQNDAQLNELKRNTTTPSAIPKTAEFETLEVIP